MGPILRLKLAQRATTARTTEAKNTSPEGIIKGQASGLTYEQIMVLSSKERRKRQKELFREHGCQMWKNFTLPVVQIPLWIAMSATIRDLTGWNDIGSSPMDSSLTTEGFLWVTDLTTSDPISILPIVLGTLALTNVEWNAKTYALQDTHVRRSLRITPLDSILNLSRFGTVFLMAIATQAPVGLVEYWITSNTFSLIQNMILDKYLPLRYSSDERFKGKEVKDGVELYERP
jgi:inner membrane protein COX18